MKKIIASLFYLLVFNALHACSCLHQTSFCEGVYESSNIALVEVTAVDHDTREASFELIELLQGDLPESFDITGWGFCPDSFEELEAGTEALVNMSSWDGNHNLAACAIGVLEYKNGKLIGQVTPDEANMKYSDFKENEFGCFEGGGRFNRNYVSVFPNPFSQTINYTTSESEITSIELYDVQGKLVFTEQIPTISNGTVNLPNLPVGLYFIKLYEKERSLTFKVMKM